MLGRKLVIILAIIGITASILIWIDQQRDALAPISGPGRYARIVSVTPSLTEIIYALGCGDDVAGVGDFVTWPPEATTKPRMGGYLNPSLETILALRPDLVVIQGRSEQLSDFCERNGIAFERFEIDRIADVYAAIARLGVLLGVESRADSLASALRAELAAVETRVAGCERPPVFYSLGHTPGEMNTLFTTGGASFVSELIGIAGGGNIFADRGDLYPEISKEVLVSRAPAIVIESAVGHADDDDYVTRLRGDWRMFSTIPAVADGRVHIITVPYLEIPGPRLGLAAAMLAKLIHPEISDE